ncbi:MAG: glycoside hydrolase family 15 protein, partial [bacterium]
MNYLPIDQYGVIGDLHTVALVGMNGSIDFMCFPQFDSASIFGAMLDSKKGGHFQIAPVLENARQKQQYLPDTNILMTRFLSDDGVAEISDYMPVDEIGHAHQVVRRVKTVRGKIRFRMSCDPRFNYGQSESRLTKRGKNEVRWEPKGGDLKALCLYGGVPLKTVGETVKAEFTLSAGEHVYFVLGEPESESGPFPLNDKFLTETFKRTADFWRDWINRSNYRGRWREMVNRSALTLKLLISKREGSMVAAPTFGLPEQLGGARNWDYRYTWIRDASFSVYGLMRLGYTDEAGAFMRWIEKRCEELTAEGTLQIMYGLNGRKELNETILPDWEGYQG